MANYWIQHNPDGTSYDVDNTEYHSDDLHAGLPCDEGVVHMTRTIDGIKHAWLAPYGDEKLGKVKKAHINVLKSDGTIGKITTSLCKFKKGKVCYFGDRKYVMLSVIETYRAIEEIKVGLGSGPMICMI